MKRFLGFVLFVNGLLLAADSPQMAALADTLFKSCTNKQCDFLIQIESNQLLSIDTLSALQEASIQNDFAKTPQPIPAPSAAKRNIISRGSLKLVRKRTMESAPSIPSPRPTLSPMACITVAATTELRTSAWTKFREYESPRKVCS